MSEARINKQMNKMMTSMQPLYYGGATSLIVCM